MRADSPVPVDELESRLIQFNKLLAELLRGRIQRTTFQPWEIEILLDIEACDLRDGNRRQVLKRYQRAANRYVDRGGRTMLKLSDYLAKKHRAGASARGEDKE
ncbi:MAG TPA: hypothetical protein PKJ41_19805 [Bryobacteraceae bacterium]|nr:hypothetical protein [Bryobacteraceae bacterium]HPT25141.1 hypothetical protein [Bryobacteraceae bacterium]